MAGRGAHLGDDAVEAVGGVLGAQPHGDVALGVAAQVGAHLSVLLQLHAQRPRAAREQGLPRRRREPGALQEQAGEGAGWGGHRRGGHLLPLVSPSPAMPAERRDLGGSEGMLGWEWEELRL